MSELLKVLSEYDSLGIKEQLDYDKFYLYSIITHSTAIEGSTVTEIENQLLFDEGISPAKTLAEQFMNLDLKAAYEKAFELAGKHTQITTELLCSLSAILMKNTGSEYNTIAGSFSSAKGELRLLNVSAGRGGKSYMAWQKVGTKLTEFCSWLNEKRAEYIKSLAESQENDNPQLFLDFMLNQHIENLLEQIREYKKSMSDDTLKVKDDTLNDIIKLSDKECAIFELIKSDLNINTDQIVEKTGFGRATVMRAIKVLKEKRLVERTGSKKTGHWEVVK